MFNTREYEAMAKLVLTDTERELIGARIENLLQAVKDSLGQIDLDDIEPMVNVLDVQNQLREDRALKNFSRQVLMDTAPEQQDGYFVVPRTVD